MVEYSKVNVKLADTQLKKLKTAVKNKTGTTLRMNLKMIDGNDLPHELLLAARQKTKLRNAFNNNMSADLKLFKAQIFSIWRVFRIIIESRNFFRKKCFRPKELQQPLQQLREEFKRKYMVLGQQL